MPRARKSRLIVKEVDGEVLIYDQEINKAHCLNPTAAKVWKYCDGKTTIAVACSLLTRDLNTHVDENLVRYAIDQFSADNLLETETSMPTFMTPGLSRRQMVRTLGLAAAVAIPIVTTIIAPTPAQANTCLGSGASCADTSQCCPNLVCTASTCQ